MSTASLTWTEPLQGRVLTAQAANVTYHIVFGAGGYGDFATFLIAIGPRGGQRRLDLGNFATLEDAQRRCEQHYALAQREAYKWRSR
jgi:hypothetical protein